MHLQKLISFLILLFLLSTIARHLVRSALAYQRRSAEIRHFNKSSTPASSDSHPTY